MSAFSRFTSLAASLPSTVPFVGPEAIERNRGKAVSARIGANESGFGPAPSVLEAMRAAAETTWMYSDPENFELREALALHHGVSRDNIAVGGGIDGLLGEIVRLVVEPGTPVVTSLGGYPTFNYHVNGFGGRLVTVPYTGDREDPDVGLARLGPIDRQPSGRHLPGLCQQHSVRVHQQHVVHGWGTHPHRRLLVHGAGPGRRGESLGDEPRRGRGDTVDGSPGCDAPDAAGQSDRGG